MSAFETDFACEKLIRQFSVFNDMNELDKLAELFVEDGSFARPMDPDNPIVGKAEILAMMKGRPPRLSRHFITNVVIEADGADAADGISYVIFLSTTDVEAARPVASEPKMFMGEYRDRFVRTPEGWRFKSRAGRMTMILDAG